MLRVTAACTHTQATRRWDKAGDLLGVLVIVASTTLVTVLGSVGSLFLDDVSLTTLGLSRPWPDVHLLTTTWFGHFMPMGWLVAWVEARVFGQSKGWYGVSQGLGFLALQLLLYDVLRRMGCGSRSRAFLLFFFASSMSVTLASGWWANALWLIPLMIITLLSVRRFVSPRPNNTAWLVALLVAGLLFTEKAVLLPAGLFVFAVAAQPELPLRAAIGSTWRRQRLLWTGYAVVTAGFLTLYVSVAGGPLSTVPFESRLSDSGEIVGRVLADGLPAGVLGGPLHFLSPILATPPEGFLTYSRLLLVLTALVVVALSRPGRRLLSWALAYVTFTAMLIAATRFLGDGAVLVVMQVRYYADVVLWMTLALALTATRPVAAWWVRVAGAFVPVTAAVMAVSAVLWAVSAKAAVEVFRDEAHRDVNSYQESMKSALSALPKGSVVLDTPLRDGWFLVIEANAGRPVLLSDYYGQFLRNDIVFASSAVAPILYLADQRALVRMVPEGHTATPSPPLCLNPAEPRDAVRLPAAVYPGLLLIETQVSSAGPAAIEVSLDGLPGGTIASIGPRQSITTWAEGGGDTVHYSLTSGTNACISRVVAGYPRTVERVAEVAP